MNSYTFDRDGFELHSAGLDSRQLDELREEADRIAADAGSVCVRGVRQKSSLFDRLATSPRFLDVLPAKLQPVRSILFDKTPEHNWPVLWHQDLTIAVTEKQEVPDYGPWSVKEGVPHTQPPSSLLQRMATLRLHLDDTDDENGALRVIPGSHRLGKLPHTEVPNHTQQTASTCSCKAGDILLMSPLLLHASHRSTHPSRRRVFHVEYAPEGALHPRLQWCEPAGQPTRTGGGS